MNDKKDLFRCGWVATFWWAAFWFGVTLGGLCSGTIDLDLNEWGDFFAGIVGPVALLWLVLGYLQQSYELGQNNEAMALQKQEMANQVAETKELAKQTAESARAAHELTELTRAQHTFANYFAHLSAFTEYAKTERERFADDRQKEIRRALRVGHVHRTIYPEANPESDSFRVATDLNSRLLKAKLAAHNLRDAMINNTWHNHLTFMEDFLSRFPELTLRFIDDALQIIGDICYPGYDPSEKPIVERCKLAIEQTQQIRTLMEFESAQDLSSEIMQLYHIKGFFKDIVHHFSTHKSSKIYKIGDIRSELESRLNSD
ncbi:hypothetical protein [Parahaliea aestuarii]